MIQEVGHKFPADWFSLGVFTFDLITGTLPFDLSFIGMRYDMGSPDWYQWQASQHKRGLKARTYANTSLADAANADVLDFIEKLLVYDPKARMRSEVDPRKIRLDES